MSWLSDLSDALGGAVAPIGDALSGAASEPGFYSSLLNTGTALYGGWAGREQQSSLTDEYMKQRQAELEYQKGLDAQNIALGWAKIKQQQKQTLGNLYAAYGQTKQRGTESWGNQNNQSAELISAPIIARAKALS